MLREKIEKYTNLTGEDGWHVPIMKVGAYLDGYNKGLEVLDKVRAEVESMCGDIETLSDVICIIKKYKAESEG